LTDTIVGLLRHGQTDWNIDFRLQGITDTVLNETGIAQAHTVGEHLISTAWDAVLTSPLTRAFETARIVTSVANLPDPRIEPKLLERSFGEAEGMTHEEWRTSYPDPHAVPGAETLDELADRAWALLDMLAADYAGSRVLTVSHGALIRKLINLVSSGTLPRDGERLGNASLSLLRHDGKTWSIENYWPQTYSGELTKPAEQPEA
jgi:broad specificity phosphatase PhoE